MTSHDVDDDNGPPENQKYWWGQAYVVGLICPRQKEVMTLGYFSTTTPKGTCVKTSTEIKFLHKNAKFQNDPKSVLKSPIRSGGPAE